MKIKNLLMVLLLCSSLAFAVDLNPRQLEHARIEIIRSGVLDVKPPIYKISLYLYIPQAFEYINVEPNDWEYVTDEYGNRMLRIDWTRPDGDVSYKITIVVNNYAEKIYDEYPLVQDSNWTKETSLVKITDDIRETAHRFADNMKGVVELSRFVYKLIDYDSGYGNIQIDSGKVMELKRGVCTEYSNLLLALLRAKKISSRAVTGYAYSSKDKDLIGHAWVEVLTTKGWVGLDPTWNEAGYIDATHIRLASLPDTNQSETISYAGKGEVRWTDNKEEFRFVNYDKGKPIDIRLQLEYKDYSGFIKMDVKGCSVIDAEVKSCIDNYKNELLDIKNSKISSWVCPEKTFYWFFSAEKGNYKCPVNVFTPFEKNTINISIVNSDESLKRPELQGPDYVLAGEKFVLSTNADDFLIYSPEFGYSKTDWELVIDNPGIYSFYLYADGLVEKNITVLEEKEFSVAISHPENVTVNSSFRLNITVQNLLNRTNEGVLEIEFQGHKKQKLFFEANEKKIVQLNLTAENYEGKIVTIISDIGLYSTSSYINVVDKPVVKTWWVCLIEMVMKWLGLL
jgi:transglutaminase-like putative cysteine protease